MSSEPIDRMVSALESHGCAPQRAGSGWRAQCPAHDDRRGSLSISPGDNGGVVLHCHAGCDPGAVVAALGLRLSDLMPNGNGRPGPKLAAGGRTYPTAEVAVEALAKQFGRGPNARWDYHDAAGDVVGLVLRWNTPAGKEIRPVSRCPSGWRIGAMPEPHPLYRLPAILASGAETPIVIGEGEKVADVAWQSPSSTP